jgi:hypothetical protein
MFALSLKPNAYLKLTHVLVSSVTVLVMARTGAAVLGRRYGLVVGVAASLYLPFLFWMPYILTETTFLLAVALYTSTSVELLKVGDARAVAVWAAAALLLMFGRPTGPPVAAATFLWLVYAWFAEHRNRRLAAFVTAGIALAGLAAITTALALPTIRQRIVHNATVVQSIWASTKVSTGNMADTRALGDLDDRVDRMFLGAPLEAKDAYKINEALTFIEAHPARYLGMTATKLFSFWLPWVFTDAWSRAHRAVDAVISLGLAIGLFLARRSPVKRSILTLAVVMTLSFIGLSAFSQIDPDGRYRVPAELPALLIAPAGWIALVAPSVFVIKCGPRAPND